MICLSRWDTISLKRKHKFNSIEEWGCKIAFFTPYEQVESNLNIKKIKKILTFSFICFIL